MTTITTAEEKVRKVRPEFDKSRARDAAGNPITVNAEGQLTGVPANWDKDYLPAHRGDFASRLLFLQYRHGLALARVAAAQAHVKDIEGEIHEETHGLDPVASMTRKRDKLAAQLAAINAQLAAEGATAV